MHEVVLHIQFQSEFVVKLCTMFLRVMVVLVTKRGHHQVVRQSVLSVPRPGTILSNKNLKS